MTTPTNGKCDDCAGDECCCPAEPGSFYCDMHQDARRILAEMDTDAGCDDCGMESHPDHPGSCPTQYRLCAYHDDSLGWDECSDGFEGCRVEEARRSIAEKPLTIIGWVNPDGTGRGNWSEVEA